MREENVPQKESGVLATSGSKCLLAADKYACAHYTHCSPTLTLCFSKAYLSLQWRRGGFAASLPSFLGPQWSLLASSGRKKLCPFIHSHWNMLASFQSQGDETTGVLFMRFRPHPISLASNIFPPGMVFRSQKHRARRQVFAQASVTEMKSSYDKLKCQHY